MSMTRRHHAQDVLHFWFGPRPWTAQSVQRRFALWFGDPKRPELTPQVDEAIRLRYGGLAREAASGELAAWESSPRRRLALILLLDQFPRSLYRGTAAAFATDRVALSLAITGLQLGADAVLDPVERIFFCMPLQHSESREVQAESVAAFRRLRDEAPPEMQALFAGVQAYAVQHHDIIERFGRFPHRNKALGREPTAEESAWLDTGGARFGQ
ncbi:MAG: DUF924 domain-containing protein [Gammaproteobacteria bacterium]|nr:DUF924 domain-containing protein [Gammaproteobacteria bacterium]